MNIRSLGANVAALREHNMALVLRQIIASPGLSRTEIASRINLTDAAVSRITRDLIEAGLVREGEEIPAEPGQRGRRHIRLVPDGGGASFLAISLTISDRRASLVDLAGRRQAGLPLRPQLPRDYPALVDDIVSTFRALAAKTRIPKHRILGAAITTAGAVDPTTGNVTTSSLGVLDGRSLAIDLSKRLRIPAVVETVGNAFGLAEAHRAMRAGGVGISGPSLVVHVAFGLGVSVMLDGRPVRSGGDERAAGHVPVQGGKNRCICGARGCLMAEAAGYGVLRRLEGVSPDEPGQGWEAMRPDALRRAVQRSQAGDPAAVAVMTEAGHILGEHLFGIGAVVAPRRILLGGPLASVSAFAGGVRTGLQAAYLRVGPAPPPLYLLGFDYLQATEILAVEEFALNRPLTVTSKAAA